MKPFHITLTLTLTLTLNFGLLIVHPCQAFSIPPALQTGQKTIPQSKLYMMERIDKFLTGAILGNAGDENTQIDQPDPQEVLVHFTELAAGSDDHIAMAHSSLSYYLRRWGNLLERGDDKGLVTQVVCTSFMPENHHHNQTRSDHIIIHQASGVKLSFRPPRRYLSYKEQKAMEKGVLPDRKGAKVDAWSPGGVELLIRTTQEARIPSITSGGGDKDESHRQLELLVRRCDIDGDTIIKFKSERTLVRRLREAIRIWQNIRRNRSNE